MRFLSLALAVALLIPIDSMSAQQAPPVEVGEQVRVTHCGPLAVYSGRRPTDCRTIDGNLVAMTADSILLTAGDEDAPVTIQRDLMTRLDVHRGRKSNWLLGMGIGFLAGAGVGAVAGAASDCEEYYDQSACIGLHAAVGAAVGLLVGTTAGSLIKSDRWEEVPLDRLRVSFAPQQDGFALGLSVSF